MSHCHDSSELGVDIEDDGVDAVPAHVETKTRIGEPAGTCVCAMSSSAERSQNGKPQS